MDNQSSGIFTDIKFSPAQRIFILIAFLCLFTFIGTIVIGAITFNGITTKSLRVATVLQDCIIFIVPAIATAILISPDAARFLGIDRTFKPLQLLLAYLAFMASIPAMNWLVELNQNLLLPESWAVLEKWMRAAENRAQESVDILLGSNTVGSLIVNILIVGVLAGFSEEIFFRGALQRIFLSSRMNSHLAIWLTAFIFSAFHMQFFGFFPRLLLGAYFGYLFYWSRSLWLPVAMHALNNSVVVYAMWHDKAAGITQKDDSFNSWGTDSAEMIIGSIIITAFIIRVIYKNRITAEKQ